MIIVKKISDLRKILNEVKKKKKIGFVPTLGYLHEGHLSLIRIAKERSDYVVVSIFINPTQFGPDEDYKNYPRNLTGDLRQLDNEGVDLVFTPDDEEIYKSDHSTYVVEEKVSTGMCGASRPGHFSGVATIVAKLFNLVHPDLTVFGAKDYQQAIVIKRMIRDLNFDIELVVGPTIREADGLAASSRNEYLNSEERQRATVLYKSLLMAEKMIKEGERETTKIKKRMEKEIKNAGGKIDYIAIVDPDDLVPTNEIKDKVLIALAVQIGNTRLIDNLVIS